MVAMCHFLHISSHIVVAADNAAAIFDEFITQRVEALAPVDIRLLDHLIIGDGACVSPAESGLL